MKKVTKFTGLLIVPLGALMFVQAYFFRGESIDTAVIATSAGLLGMLPKGLVLLISIGLAVGAIRLSKKNVLVRDLHSLENLAHCDVVCLDKTGTLTEGNLEVESVRIYTDEREFLRLMATYLVRTNDNNSTYRALSDRFERTEPYESVSVTPFSSERKWSSVTLSDGRTLLLSELCLLLNTDFPFIPIQITLIDAVIEAFSAFFMSFERNDSKVEGSFLGSALRSALPNSIVIFIGCAAVFFASQRLGLNHAQMNLVMYLTVGIISLAGVVKACMPINLLHGFLIIASVLGFFCAVLLFVPLLQLPHIAVNGALLLSLIAVPCILIALRLKVPAPEKFPLPVRK